MLEAITTDLVSTISLKRSTQNLQLSTSWPADYPICGLRVKVADRTDLPFAGLVEHSEVAEQLVAEMTKRPSQSSAWPAIAAPLPTIAAPPLAKSSAAIRLS